MTWHVVTPELPPHVGGVATWAAAMIRGLRDAGEDVVAYAPARVGADAVPMRGRSWGRWGGLWAALAVGPRLRRGDVVLAATWPLATHLVHLGAPVAVAYHGSDLTRPPRCPGFDDVRRRALHFPVSAYLGGLLDAPYTVLPAPVDAAPPAVPGDAVLVVARLVPTKGVDDALRLAARLGRPAIVVGDGPERPALEGLAATLPVPVRFTGALPPEAIPWDGAWALALLARPDPAPVRVVSGWRTPAGGEGQEGLGLVLLEAAARGVPSLGSAVGGIPEAASAIVGPSGEPPPLPAREAVRAAFVERHGVARAVAALRARVFARG